MRKETEAEIRQRLEENPDALLPPGFSAEGLWRRMEPALPPKPKRFRADDAIAGLLGLLLIVALAWPRISVYVPAADSRHPEKASTAAAPLSPRALDNSQDTVRRQLPAKKPNGATQVVSKKRRALLPAPIEREAVQDVPPSSAEALPVKALPVPSVPPSAVTPAPVKVVPQKAVVHLLDLKNADLRRAAGPVSPPRVRSFFSKLLSRDRVPDPSIAPADFPSPLSTLN